MKFSKAFEQPKQDGNVIAPAEYLELLNSDAPLGTHFESEDGIRFYMVDNNSSETKIKFKIVLPESLKGIKIRSSEDISTLLYRAQQTIEIQEVRHVIGGHELDPDEVFKIFGDKIDSKNSKYYLQPKKSPSIPVPISVWLDQNEYKFIIKHHPYPSLEEMIFESVNEDVLNLRLVFNTITKKVKITFTYNFNKAISLDSILEQKEKLLDYSTGRVKIFGQSFIIESSDESSRGINRLLDFYEKLDKLAKMKDIEFDIKQTIMNSDYVNLSKIYFSMFENQFYFLSSDKEINEVSVDSKEDMPRDLLENEIAITGFNLEKLSVLNQVFDVFEQFVFKKVKYSGVKNKAGYKFNVLADKIKYQKLHLDNEPGEEVDFNAMMEDLDVAKEISSD
ncbi:abortive infection system toxin AbiGii family protein [Listeria kieliensis]